MLLMLSSLLIFSSFVSGFVFNLSDLSWTLQSENKSIVVPGNVPSHAHLDLARAGIITEPLLGINDYTQRWVAATNWTYTADLSRLLDMWKDVDEGSKLLLVFHGLDTIANITLAGRPLAWVNNQFRRYTFDVTDFLPDLQSTSFNRNLTLDFWGAYEYGLNVSRSPGREIIPTSQGRLSDDYEYPGVRFWVRKIQDDFGWDWGPAFLPCGIFKPAYFVILGAKISPSSLLTEGYLWVDETRMNLYREEKRDLPIHPSSLFIEEKSLEIYKENQRPSIRPNESAPWILNITVTLRSMSEVNHPYMEINISELNISSGRIQFARLPSDGTPTVVTVGLKISDDIPRRWYPHNLGEPKRYNVTVALMPWNRSFTTTTGFRTIVLVQDRYTQEEIDSRGITAGDNYHFEINGKPFYAKGTNLIPFDPFYPRINPDSVRWILESVVAGGQNMIRIWGGGIYQPSDSETGGYSFYDICDELGILAWSELIFSDSVYPVDDDLWANIETEVRENVRRINKHPSNAQWAGGNEIEGIVMGAGRRWMDEFVAMFQDFLHDIVTSETRSVSYTACSTTNGVLSLEPYILRFGNQSFGELYGNSERFNYDAGSAFNYHTYPTARFVNEFGFHSMPSFYSWEEVLEHPDDFDFYSLVVVSRDHHPPAGSLTWPNPGGRGGQMQMANAVQMWLPTPATNSPNQTFAQWCWSTQIFQGLAMASQIAFYRRGTGRPENNLGALMWQLNDIWQGISWSSIEYSGRWKATHYLITRTFAPIIIYPFWDASTNTLEVTVISDRLEPTTGTAALLWLDWSGKIINSKLYPFTVPPLNNTIIYNATGMDQVLPLGYRETEVWLRMNVEVEVSDGIVINEQYFNPAPLSKVVLQDPNITMTHIGDMTFTVAAHGGVGVFTWLDHPAGTVGYFVDASTKEPCNGFYLIPGHARTVIFLLNFQLSKRVPSAGEFIVRSLWNNTHL